MAERMREDEVKEQHVVNWIVPKGDLTLFTELATTLGHEAHVIGEAGDCIKMGSAESEIAEGNVGVELTSPDTESYYEFVDALREAHEAVRNQ